MRTPDPNLCVCYVTKQKNTFLLTNNTTLIHENTHNSLVPHVNIIRKMLWLMHLLSIYSFSESNFKSYSSVSLWQLSMEKNHV